MKPLQIFCYPETSKFAVAMAPKVRWLAGRFLQFELNFKVSGPNVSPS